MTCTVNVNPDRVAGLVYGLALGDSWGKDTEFLTYEEIAAHEPYYSLPPMELVITDDTQMSLYGLDAVREILNFYTLDELETLPENTEMQDAVRSIFADRYVEFAYDPLNNRAPGRACMNSLFQYDKLRMMGNVTRGDEGTYGITAKSKGCGTIMRAPWLAAMPIGERALATIAIIQSQVTHGHPTAGISAAWMALTIRSMLTSNGDEMEMAFVSSYPAKVLKTLSTTLVPRAQLREFCGKFVKVAYKGTGEYIKGGFGNPCDHFGEGWIADEAFFCAALAAFAERHDVQDAMKHLVMSSGDSDSLGALGGAMLGACYGLSAFEEFLGDFTDDFEDAYTPQLQAAVRDMTVWAA